MNNNDKGVCILWEGKQYASSSNVLNAVLVGTLDFVLNNVYPDIYSTVYIPTDIALNTLL